jgi:RHS repeat-associated protein
MLQLSSSTVNYYIADHLGSSRIVTNSSGTVLDDSDFYPFGGERSYSSSSGNNYKFTGKERDTESGLDDFTARFYTSNYGRFLSPDEYKYANPADPQTLNLYGYVANNPINSVDPTGHAPHCLVCDMPTLTDDGGPTAVGPESGTSTEAESIDPSEVFDNIWVSVGDAPGGSGQKKPPAKPPVQPPAQQFVLVPDAGEPTVRMGLRSNNEQDIIYTIHELSADGKLGDKNTNHTLELQEKVVSGAVTACTASGSCTGRGAMQDDMVVYKGSDHSVVKTFKVDGKPAKMYDPVSKQSYDYAIVKASFQLNPKTNSAFVFEYHNGNPK